MKQACPTIIGYIIALGLFSSCLQNAAAEPLSHTQVPPDPLAATLAFSTSSEDIVLGLRQLADQAPVCVNLEILVRYRRPLYPMIYPVKGFAIPPGTYTIRDILGRFQKALPALEWTNDGKHINLVIPLDRGIDNPFSDKLKTKVSGTKVTTFWLAWLEAQDPSSGIDLQRGVGYDSDDPNPMFIDPVALNSPPGAQIRTVLNKIADQLGGHWIAEIRDVNASYMSTLKNGKWVFVRTYRNETSGRTQVNVLENGKRPTLNSTPVESTSVAPVGK